VRPLRGGADATTAPQRSSDIVRPLRGSATARPSATVQRLRGSGGAAWEYVIVATNCEYEWKGTYRELMMGARHLPLLVIAVAISNHVPGCVRAHSDYILSAQDSVPDGRPEWLHHHTRTICPVGCMRSRVPCREHGASFRRMLSDVENTRAKRVVARQTLQGLCRTTINTAIYLRASAVSSAVNAALDRLPLSRILIERLRDDTRAKGAAAAVSQTLQAPPRQIDSRQTTLQELCQTSINSAIYRRATAVPANAYDALGRLPLPNVLIARLRDDL
jgi:hypothetical protein